MNWFLGCLLIIVNNNNVVVFIENVFWITLETCFNKERECKRARKTIMEVNLSTDRILHLLILIILSIFFGFVVHYWTGSSLLFSFSGGVTVAVQVSNVVSWLRQSDNDEDNKENSPNESEVMNDKKQNKQSKPNNKKLKISQRKLRQNKSSTGES